MPRMTVGSGRALLNRGFIPHRYWRINVTAFANGTYLAFSECELRFGGVDQVPTMTAATTSGVTVSASHEDHPAWNAFDGIPDDTFSNHCWTVVGHAASEWIKVDFGAGNPKALTSIAIAPEANNSTPPTAFTVDWSDDNSSWNTVFSASGLTAGWTGNTLREFLL